MGPKPGCCTRSIGKFPLAGRPKPIIPRTQAPQAPMRIIPRPTIKRPGF